MTIDVSIPGFGSLAIHSLVLDFSGTLSEFGKLLPGVEERLGALAGKGVGVHVLTSDTFGTARKALAGVRGEVTLLAGEDHHLQKARFVEQLGADGVIAIGNGRNDRAMLRRARLGICVCLAEGCAVEALVAGDLLFTDIRNALDCILDGSALKASLRS